MNTEQTVRTNLRTSSRAWDVVGIVGIVVTLAFLIGVVTPMLHWNWYDTVLSIVLLLVIAICVPLFVTGMVRLVRVLRRDGTTVDASGAQACAGTSAAMGTGLVALMALVGLLGVVFALSLLPFHPALSNSPGVVVAAVVKPTPQPQTPSELYLDLLKKSLTRAQVAGPYERYALPPTPTNRLVLYLVEPVLHATGYDLVGLRASTTDAYVNAGGSNSQRLDDAETMVGLTQLDNMQACITDVLQKQVPGDLIEAGAWRGGMTIFMRGVLKANGVTDRSVWVADSFEGLPPVDRAKDSDNYYKGDMAVALDDAKLNFARYGLLDDQVHFLKGYFSDTLPGAPIQKLAILRVDADLYASTMDAFNNLYSKLSVGGYAIIDDYVQEPAVKRAVDEYRAAHGITEPIQSIDGQAVYWHREH